MKIMMAQAIVLARSLKDKLLINISIAEARAALDQLQKLEVSELPLNLIDKPVREATAAGAGALFDGRPNSRESYLIIDVGAGTTDVAGCICRTSDEWERPRVWEVTNAADAIKSAGNILDDALLKLALNKCGLFAGSAEYQAAAISVRRDKRLYKEQLFDNGSVVIEMPTGVVVTIEVQEFLDYPPVMDFTQRIRALVGKAAIAVAGDYKQVNLVATGGGANLPMIKRLADEGADFEGRHVSIVWRDSIPSGVAEQYPDLVAPYSQIAVALGGCLPILPEQRASIVQGILGAPKTVLMPSYKS
jgi:actin-like ATPase involved in cell morphogenesis